MVNYYQAWMWFSLASMGLAGVEPGTTNIGKKSYTSTDAGARRVLRSGAVELQPIEQGFLCCVTYPPTRSTRNGR